MSEGISLEKACYKADLKAVRELLAGGAAVSFAALRNAVLSGTRAAGKKKLPICKLLLDAGADPNAPAPSGHASVMDVAAGGASAEVLQLLIDAGGRVDTEGDCLVHSAVGWNQPDNIRVLLAAGADPNLPLTGERLTPGDAVYGLTALEYATHLKHKKCVAVLSEQTPAKKAS